MYSLQTVNVKYMLITLVLRRAFAPCRFSPDELVAVSLRFTVNEYEGRHYQDILVVDIHRLNR